MREKVRAAIVSSKCFADFEKMRSFISHVCRTYSYDIVTVLSSGERGADSLAEHYAQEKGIELKVFKSDCSICSKEIIDSFDICFAFWDGESHGTEHDICLCVENGKPCYVCRFKETEENEGSRL